jgi:hypothetical protein
MVKCYHTYPNIIRLDIINYILLCKYEDRHIYIDTLNINEYLNKKKWEVCCGGCKEIVINTPSQRVELIEDHRDGLFMNIFSMFMCLYIVKESSWSLTDIKKYIKDFNKTQAQFDKLYIKILGRLLFVQIKKFCDDHSHEKLNNYGILQYPIDSSMEWGVFGIIDKSLLYQLNRFVFNILLSNSKYLINPTLNSYIYNITNICIDFIGKYRDLYNKEPLDILKLKNNDEFDKYSCKIYNYINNAAINIINTKMVDNKIINKIKNNDKLTRTRSKFNTQIMSKIKFK